jgi:hypothetical protein
MASAEHRLRLALLVWPAAGLALGLGLLWLGMGWGVEQWGSCLARG